jgi:predicted RNA-binding Zn ribbon-like protein
MMSHAATRDGGVLVPAPADTLCLDFANTQAWRGTGTPAESLGGPADLLSWLARAGLPGGDDAGLRWQAAPDEAGPMFRAAVDLRETIYQVLALADPPAGDLAALNAALQRAPARDTLVRTGEGFAWRSAPWSPTLPCLMAPVLWAAADLLAGPRRGLVRQCANPRCLWLFIDESRTGNRRWCSMAGCGNRAKARRHYQRARENRPAAA